MIKPVLMTPKLELQFARERAAYLETRVIQLQTHIDRYKGPENYGLIPAGLTNDFRKTSRQLTTAKNLVKKLSRRKNPVPVAKGTRKMRKKVKRKPTQKQIAAQMLFAKRAKSGFFRKKPVKGRLLKTARKTVRKKNPSFRVDDMVRQLKELANLTGAPYQLETTDAGVTKRYQVSYASGPLASPYLTADEMKTWLHGALATAGYILDNKPRLPRK